MTHGILLTNIKGLVQVRDQSPGFLAGRLMSELPLLSNAYLLLSDGKISDYGKMENLPAMQADETIDASGRFVFPSFVDSHTHLVFAATREEEFVLKIKGATYAEIAAKGGGILNSTKKLRTASEHELFKTPLQRPHQIIKLQTSPAPTKT